MSSFSDMLKKVEAKNLVPKKYLQLLEHFYSSYKQALLLLGKKIEDFDPLFNIYLESLVKQFQTPFHFQPYHTQVRSPFDHYLFGINFVRPLVDMAKSFVLGLENLEKIISYLKLGSNVILFANHQTEGDPQALSLLLEKICPHYISELILVAGERVITDPLAIPFSMGCNLLCIYSKRYIDHPPKDKREKQLHNKRTLELMSDLLRQGGKWIYVAPSGGRDRPNSQGVVEVDPFDPQSIEFFYLMAKRAGNKTHFFPLALKTYDLLPPPETIQVELGEQRTTKSGPIFAAFGPEIEMENFPGSDVKDRHEKRKLRAEYIYNLVKRDYEELK